MSPLPADAIPIEGKIVSVYATDDGEVGPVVNQTEIDDAYGFDVLGDHLQVGNVPGHDLNMLQFVGGVQRPNQPLGVAVGDSATFAAADFGALDTHPNEVVTIPMFSGEKHLALWYMADGHEINVMRIVGDNHNYIDVFSAPVALPIGAANGFYIATSEPIANARGGAKVLAYSTTGLSTFTRYGALRAEADGNDFVASDFTGTDGFSSTTGVVRDTRTAPDLGSIYYRAVAVPDDQLDVTGILSPGFSGYEFDNIGNFERQSGTIEIGGVDYKVWRSIGRFNDISSMNVLIQQVPQL